MATNVPAPMHKNRTTTMGRISGFISKNNIFRDINLSSKMYSETEPFTSIHKWSLPGGSGAWQNFTFRQIVDDHAADFTPANVGDSFGPTWSTHWFRVVVNVPDSWAGKEVHLRFNSNSEATLWRDNGENGEILQGITSGSREEYILSKSWTPAEESTFYYEMACNGLFGAGAIDMIAPPDPNRNFQLQRAEIAVFERQTYKVYMDLDVLHQIADRLGNDHKGYQAMFTANEMVTLISRGEIGSASELADAYFAEGNGKKVHRLISMGHCHIDTAWLWPYAETIRKCARSWSSQIKLMDEYEANNFVFACSSALQYAWMKEYYPDFFEQIKVAVATGRFVPVGGAWIEMDGNIPNGEAFMRQFFYGQRFFNEEFGILCKEFWLPDTFGYSAQIPQMMKHVGIDHFITQKMSWNLVNKFPNHNFWWEGIDGTQVLTHFPPGNSYNMNGNVEEVLFSQNNSEDKGRANVGIYLYGIGDGGGGPTREMIEKQIRLKDVDGIPQVIFETPEYFWQELEKESSKLYKWVGELYLELHNGTYTSQAKIKWYNRKCEFLFREIELLIAIAYSSGKITQAQLTIDVATVDKNWKQFLLNQFHDVLPGSCIELVTQDAWKIYGEIFTEIIQLRSTYHTILLGAGTTTRVVYNPLPWKVRTVIFNRPDTGNPITGPNFQSVILDPGAIEESGQGRFRVPNAFTAGLVNMEASGYTNLVAIAPANPVVLTTAGSTATYNNGLVRLTVSTSGMLTEDLHFTGPSGMEQSVYSDRLGTGTSPAAFYIYDDVPLYWDAWDVMDYHLETRNLPSYVSPPVYQSFAGGPIVGGFKWTGTFGNGSTIVRYAIMRADSPMVEYYVIVDWKESHKFLKVEFPVDILSREATYEIQYGHAKRPTHINTSWDMAKFEVCGHKWMDVSQSGKGVTFITDSKYGWHVRDNIVKLSLLKSPKNPDGNCDMHKHFIYYAVLPHEGTLQEADVIRRAYELNYLGSNNVPVLTTAQTSLPVNWVVPENSSIIVEAFKAAHDVARAVVVRLYESHGGSATTKINLGFPVVRVNECNGLEVVGDVIPNEGNSFTASFTPFKIRSFIITF